MEESFVQMWRHKGYVEDFMLVKDDKGVRAYVFAEVETGRVRGNADTDDRLSLSLLQVCEDDRHWICVGDRICHSPPKPARYEDNAGEGKYAEDKRDKEVEHGGVMHSVEWSKLRRVVCYDS